jgi:hypothetical protein
VTGVAPADIALEEPSQLAAERDNVHGQKLVTAPLSILLPGLDGTAELFARFVAAAPAEFPVRPSARSKTELFPREAARALAP